MKKNKLIRGNVKRAIAVASAFMMMCNPVLGAPLNSVNSAHAEESGNTGTDQGNRAETEGVGTPDKEETKETVPSGEQGKTGESELSGESEKAGESEAPDEPEKTDESEASDGSERVEESEAPDEPEKDEESEASDEAGKTEKGEASDESGKTEEGAGSDAPEKGGENNPSDESGEAEEGDVADKSEEDEKGKADEPDQSDVAVGESAITGNTQRAVQQTAFMIMRETGLWYIEKGNYGVEDGYYYLLDESGENSERIKDQFVEAENPEKPGQYYIIYVDDSGKQVKNKWLGNESDGFRYVNSKGKVIRDEKGKVAGGYFGDFAEDGYWTARTFEFFETEEDNGTLVKKYAGETGEIAGVGEKENRRHYCFEEEEGHVRCFLLAGKGDTMTKEPVADTWIEDLRVDAEGCLIVGADMQLINHKYYNFDEEGHSELVIDTFIYDEDGSILCYMGEDGAKVTNQFVSDGEHTYYFGEDGALAPRRWIEDKEGRFRYVDGKGRMVVDTVKAAGGYYGEFDRNGYWTPIAFTFFQDETGEGSSVIKYSGEEAKVAGIGEKDQHQQYFFVGDGSGTTKCGLLTKDGAISDTKVADVWIDDLRVDADGYLIKDAKHQLIDSKYYDFDEEGHSNLVKDTFIYDTDGTIICYVGGDGEKVTNEFVSDNEYTYYFGGDGAQVFSQWIKDGEKRRYVDEDGHLVVNITRSAGGYYGTFDTDGDWTAIEHSFFKDKLTSGDPVTKYAGAGGEIAGIGEEDRQYYGFVTDENGTVKCGLISKEEDTITEMAVANVWIDDLWVDDTGHLVTNTLNQQVGNKYYNFDGDGHSKLVTGTFIYDTNGTVVCYVGEDGEKVTNKFVSDDAYTYYFGVDGAPVRHQWIDGADGRFRYVDGEGHLVVNKKKIVGGYYGTFDKDGYWTAIEHEFFESELKDGTPVTKYVGAEGKVAAIGDKETRQYYCFIKDAVGMIECGLISKEEDTITEMAVANVWIDDLWVDDTGHLVTNTLNQQVGNKYYNFDGDGHSKLVTGTFIYDTNGTVVCYVGEDGEKVTNKFVSDGAYTYYFGVDGAPVYHQWIDGADGRFRYVDGEGHLVVNQKKIVGGYYGTFDKDGYWTAIEHEFFESKLKDGTPVTKYVGAEGKVAAIGDKETRQYYCFIKDAAGMIECGLISKEEDTITEMAVANVWIDDLWVDDTNHLVVGTQNYQVGEYYYNFDELGHGKLVANAFIYGTDGKLICYVGEDGRKVAGRFVSDGVYTYYFKADGTQAFHQWIDDADGRFRYVDGKGHLVVNKKKVAGGYYGSFDRDGYWTAIEHEFFTDELNDGTSVTKYAGNGGKVAGIGEKENRQYYSFKKRVTGEIVCCLISEKEDIITETAVSNVWIEDMWVNADGFLVRDAEEAVDGVYYYFDQDGHGTVRIYTVSYVLNGGTNSDANPVSYTGAMDTFVLEAPTRAGYTFGGWFMDRSFTNQITEIASKSHGDLILYAKWLRNSNGSDGGSSDSGSDSNSGSGDNSNTTSSGATNTTDTTANSNPSAVTVTMGDGQNIVVQTGGTSVSASAVQTAEGSVSGNTIVTVTETATVPVAEGQVAEVATIAVGTDGSTRTLLASQEQGAKVQQVTVVTPQGVTVTQNVVVYTDGTQVIQKSGAAELEGFADAVASSEQAIQNGTQTVADVYNDKVDIDLQQYSQVGSAVTYAVTPGVNGAVPQMQVEQTSFAPGQEVTALITDANGNVKAVTLTVGANGIVQYEIPGVNCIVRFMRKNG